MTLKYVAALFVAVLAATVGARTLLISASRQLAPPCYVPNTWYPERSCRRDDSPSVCARGFNTYESVEDCCTSGGVGAFPDGCSAQAPDCIVVTSYFPKMDCGPSTNSTKCAENWGRWNTYEDCCAVQIEGGAFPNGCTKPGPCWAMAESFPQRTCAVTDNSTICMRGWGAFVEEGACCALGGAFSDGCTHLSTGERMPLPVIVDPMPSADEFTPFDDRAAVALKSANSRA